MEKKRKWRWGVNRWIVLGLIILSIIGTKISTPILPEIAVAAENVVKEPLFTLPKIGNFYLTNTLVATLFVDLVIIIIALIVRKNAKKDAAAEKSPRGLTGVMEMAVEGLYNLTETTAGKWAKQMFPWFATILIFVLFANLLKLLPGFESIGWMEPSAEGTATASIGGHWWIFNANGDGEKSILIPFLRGASTDLNFTLALALIAVTMTQVMGVKAKGVHYFSKFINVSTIFKKPFLGFMDFIVGVLEIISEVSKILSFTFRLFGNMFSGMVLMALIGTMLPVFMPSAIMLFELFIGLIQAFVFGMLTLVFMAQATQGHGEEASS